MQQCPRYALHALFIHTAALSAHSIAYANLISPGMLSAIISDSRKNKKQRNSPRITGEIAATDRSTRRRNITTVRKTIQELNEHYRTLALWALQPL